MARQERRTHRGVVRIRIYKVSSKSLKVRWKEILRFLMISNQASKDDQGRVRLANLRDCLMDHVQPVGVETGNSIVSIGSPTPGDHNGGCLLHACSPCEVSHTWGPRQPVAGASGLDTACVAEQAKGTSGQSQC